MLGLGCGSTHGGAEDAGDGGALDDAGVSDGGDGGAVVSHGNLPEIPYNLGPLLSQPKLVTVVFAGSEHVQQHQDFGDWVVTSPWFNEVGAEYGIGAGTHLDKAVLSDPAPGATDENGVESFLLAELWDGGLSAPTDAGHGFGDQIYLLYLPSSSSVTGHGSCSGYHSWLFYQGLPFPYAVVLSCTADTSGLCFDTGAASHELIEAATDPFPQYHNGDPGYALTDPRDPYTAIGGEIADLCDFDFVKPGPYCVTRVWSNAAADAGRSPCVPALDGGVYFTVSIEPATVQVASPGETVTYQLTGWSTAPIAPWPIVAHGYDSTFTPKIALSATSLGPGGTATLKVTVPTDAPPFSYATGALFSGDYSARQTPGVDLNFTPFTVRVQ